MNEKIEDIIPTEFELAQNYPNPFRERTTIKYCVPEKMKIRLEVFDLKGNKVKMLVDEIIEAGTHKVEFDSNKLTNGEYIYKLETKDYFDTKKMILLK
jgi:5-hydroxyisourate hydrolase-like protein (transthyretin family)